MAVQINNPAEIAEKITEKLPHGDRALFILVLVFVGAIIAMIWIFLGQIDKQSEITDRREQRTMVSIDRLSESINQNTRVMDEVLDELKTKK